MQLPKIMNHAVAFGSMCIGGTMVFALVISLNSQKSPPKEAPKESVTEFQVEKKAPPKKKKEKTQRPQRARQTTAQAPRAPDLSSNISDVALDFSGASSMSLGAVSNDLIGKFDKSGPMAEGALDSPPKIQSKGGTQAYPTEARKDGLEGYVLLNIHVRGDGSVGNVKILDASPRGVFEESAKTFVQEWSFQAGTYEGQSVDAWVKQKVVYKLQRS